MVYEADFDQRAYGLQLPPFRSEEYCKKATRVWASFPEIEKMSRQCPGMSESHRHVHAQGSVKHDGRWVSLAKAAGAYPAELCAVMADSVCAAFAAGGPRRAPVARHARTAARSPA